jgi:hypothetical protein
VVLLLAQLGRTKPASSGLQGAKFCGVASRKTEPAGLCFLLPVEQQELRVLLAQRHCFPWSFIVKIEDHM